MMFEIRLPKDNKLTGEYLSISFLNGIGKTKSKFLADKAAQKGCTVSEISENQKPLNIEQLLQTANAELENSLLKVDTLESEINKLTQKLDYTENENQKLKKDIAKVAKKGGNKDGAETIIPNSTADTN